MSRRQTFPILVFLMLVLSMMPVNSWIYNNDGRLEDARFEMFGPRVDELLIKISPNFELLVNETDITEHVLSPELIQKYSMPPYNETIALAQYPEMTMYILDINNNETIPTYQSWRSPTSYLEFRHAIAHLVNRTRIVTQILNGSGKELTTPIMPWLEKWFNPNADSHPFNPLEAVRILDAVNFTQGSTPNPYYDPSKPESAQFIRVYPVGHEKAGQDLDTLIFYARYDHPPRLETAYIIRDELLSVGIPVRIQGPIRIQEMEDIVLRKGNYHLYTGSWMLGVDSAYLYWLYHSSNYGYPNSNYNNVQDEELDYWLERLFNAISEEEGMNACREAQRRFAEAVGSVPLWAPLRTKAYRKGWQGVVNQENLGANSWWAFLNMHPQGIEQGGTIRYGLTDDVEQLNAMFSWWYSDWLVLDKIYDTLINYNPYNAQVIPWLCEDWNIEPWMENYTKLTLHLRENIYWHDGEEFTADDVKFTIKSIQSRWDYPMRGLSLPTFYPTVEDILDVDTPDRYTVVVYMNSPYYHGIWALHALGVLPIIPKHIWENITNDTGFAPDPNLIGTGPFKFVEYVKGDHVLLEANTHYFKYCPLQATVKATSTRVKPGESVNCNVTIRNCYAEEPANVTVYVQLDETLMHTQTMVLDANTTLTLGPFNTGPLAKGSHRIKVTHSTDPTLHRNCTYTKTIWVTIVEDINMDYEVEGKDIALVAKAFDSSPGHSRWNSICDVTGDYMVEGKDMATVVKKFGKAF
jgi:ABC-type transport system substrate-binding protein